MRGIGGDEKYVRDCQNASCTNITRINGSDVILQLFYMMPPL
jgi:hypothetical protein